MTDEIAPVPRNSRLLNNAWLKECSSAATSARAARSAIRWIGLSDPSRGAGVCRALLHQQWLGDLPDEPVGVEQVGVGESHAVV